MIRDETAFLHMTGQGIHCAFDLTQFIKKCFAEFEKLQLICVFNKVHFSLSLISSLDTMTKVTSTKNFKGLTLCMLINVCVCRFFSTLLILSLNSGITSRPGVILISNCNYL